jgi:catechol 2,3-dioxygenase-like lactoylglutathione lyase family enzyme
MIFLAASVALFGLFGCATISERRLTPNDLRYGLTHIALGVTDAKRSFRFYQKVFGMKAVCQKDGFVQAQTPGSRDVLVFQEESKAAGKAGGVAHFGWRLVDAADIDLALRAVRAAGGEVLSHGEFSPGQPYLFFTDPDGYEAEIWHEPPTRMIRPRPDGTKAPWLRGRRAGCSKVSVAEKLSA